MHRDTSTTGKESKKKFEKNSKKESHNKYDKSEGKNVFCVGSSEKSSDYDITSQFLTNDINK